MRSDAFCNDANTRIVADCSFVPRLQEGQMGALIAIAMITKVNAARLATCTQKVDSNLLVGRTPRPHSALALRYVSRALSLKRTCTIALAAAHQSLDLGALFGHDVSVHKGERRRAPLVIRLLQRVCRVVRSRSLLLPQCALLVLAYVSHTATFIRVALLVAGASSAPAESMTIAPQSRLRSPGPLLRRFAARGDPPLPPQRRLGVRKTAFAGFTLISPLPQFTSLPDTELLTPALFEERVRRGLSAPRQPAL